MRDRAFARLRRAAHGVIDLRRVDAAGGRENSGGHDRDHLQIRRRFG